MTMCATHFTLSPEAPKPSLSLSHAHLHTHLHTFFFFAQDDGSLFFNTHLNLLVYGHQKFKVGAIKNYDNILSYVSDFAGKWSGPGEDGYEPNGMSGNRVVFATDGAQYHDCSWVGSLAYNNTLFGSPLVAGASCPGGKAMSLAEWQALNPQQNDVGSTSSATRPSGAEIMGWARALLFQ